MVITKANGSNGNMEMLKSELRQLKKALACQDKKVRELTTRLETETEDKIFLSHQNKYLSAENKKMQTRRLGKKRESDNLRDANEQLPRAENPLTAAEATDAQNVCTAQRQCLQEETELQLESRDNRIQTLEKMIQASEAKLQEKTQQLAQCLEEAEQQTHDFKEIMKHAEEDEVKKIHEIKLRTEKKLQRLKADLHNCVDFIQEPKKLKDSLLRIYARYVSQTERQEISNVDRDAHRAVYRQRDCLERTINSLKMKLAKSGEEHQKIYTRINNENVSMIKEINELHTELRLLRTQVKDVKTQLSLNKKSSYIMSHVRSRRM